MSTVKNSIFKSLLCTTGLGLLLQIPIVRIEGLISDRTTTEESARREVAHLAGDVQRVDGPILRIPYAVHSTDQNGAAHTAINQAILFPDSLQVKGDVQVENRYRGIFEIPVYVSTLTLEGSFEPGLIGGASIKPEDILWKDSILTLGITEPRAIRDQVALNWNEHSPVEFEPGADGVGYLTHGIHVKIPGEDLAPKTTQHFRITISMGGSSALEFVPLGRNTSVALKSNWADPSFTGAYLPVTREVRPNGFDAAWKITDLGRGFSQVQYDSKRCQDKTSGCSVYPFGDSVFGVNFISPVDGHRMTDRAIKYELVIISLTFLTLFLFEVFCKIRIHGVQYLLAGSALVLFYLLLLSLSEHLGFGASYFIASGVIAGLVTAYSRSILGKSQRSWFMTAVVGGLYGFFYTLLNAEDYALLIGSIGLTVILGAVMYLTREINWYELSADTVGGEQPPAK